MGYRTGRYEISNKAWRKLEAAEQAAGIQPPHATAPDLLSRIRTEFYLPVESDFEGKTAEQTAEILEAMGDAMKEMDRRRTAFTDRLLSAARDGGLSIKIKGHDTFTPSGTRITAAEVTAARTKLDDLKRRAGSTGNQPMPADHRKKA